MVFFPSDFKYVASCVWDAGIRAGFSAKAKLRARLARYGYQYLREYPNTSFRILRKTRLGYFRILVLNIEYQILDIRLILISILTNLLIVSEFVNTSI
jgi:hypothetical protein